MKDISEQLVASRVIYAAAGTASKNLDTFSNWLMLGYAAGVGLLLDKGDRYLAGPALHRLIVLFLCVAGLGILAKYLYVLVSSASTGNAIGREAAAGIANINPGVLMDRLLKGLPQPARLLARRPLARAAAGDLLSSPRRFFRLAQIQGALTMLQAACLVDAVYTVYACAIFR